MAEPSSSEPASKPAAAASESTNGGIISRRFPRTYRRYERVRASRFGRISSTIWTRKRPILIGLGLSYGAINYALAMRDTYIRDYIYPDSWLVLKVYPGSIVECKSGPGLAQLLHTPSPGEELPRQMELFDLIRAIKWAQIDERVKGIFADFSGLHIPTSVAPAPLGLAQVEELIEAIHEFKIVKKQQLDLAKQAKKANEQPETSPSIVELLEGENVENAVENITAGKDDANISQIESIMKEDSVKSQEKKEDSSIAKEGKVKEEEETPVTIAWADSFDSQSTYLLASVFDKLYVQASGSVPLMGSRMELPFFKRALDWLGIKVNVEARRDQKSIVSSFIQEDELPPAQLEDEAKLLGELSRSIAHGVGVNRFPEMDHEEAADKVMEIMKEGPFSAREAAEKGLITGTKYKREVIKMLGTEPTLRSFSSYFRVTDRQFERKLNDDERLNVAIVYLLGGISNAPGEFSASQAIKGLREAGEDPDVTSIVLRIDSGGGDTVASDSIWDAVKRVQEEYNKPVVASFGNISASGGYFAACHADAIFACESTITGSIGVAAFRPTVTKKFFERIGVRQQTLYTGSNEMSLIHGMDEKARKRFSGHIDEIYEDFLEKVCTGRSISRDVIEELAGGRVWTGLAAWVRCNPEKETESAGEGAKALVPSKETGEQSKDSEDKELSVDAIAIPSVKVVSLTNDWKAVNVTQEGEMATYRIDAVPFESVESVSEKEDSTIMEEIREAMESVVEKVEEVKEGIEELDDDSKLAMAAHKEAEETNGNHHKINGEINSKTDEEPQLGPYGKGLIDVIGGVWDACHYALSLAVQREVDGLVKEGMTIEEASQKVFPGAKRAFSEDGVMALATDPRLVRYPKEKTFYERLGELRKKGDQPQLSLFFPGLTNLTAQIKELCVDTVVQTFVRSWSDPEFLRKVQSAIEKEQKMKMERQYHVQY